MAKKYQIDQHTQMTDPIMIIQRLVVNYPSGTAEVDVNLTDENDSTSLTFSGDTIPSTTTENAVKAWAQKELDKKEI